MRQQTAVGMVQSRGRLERRGEGAPVHGKYPVNATGSVLPVEHSEAPRISSGNGQIRYPFIASRLLLVGLLMILAAILRKNYGPA